MNNTNYTQPLSTAANIITIIVAIPVLSSMAVWVLGLFTDSSEKQATMDIHDTIMTILPYMKALSLGCIGFAIIYFGQVTKKMLRQGREIENYLKQKHVMDRATTYGLVFRVEALLSTLELKKDGKAYMAEMDFVKRSIEKDFPDITYTQKLEILKKLYPNQKDLLS